MYGTVNHLEDYGPDAELAKYFNRQNLVFKKKKKFETINMSQFVFVAHLWLWFIQSHAFICKFTDFRSSGHS